MNDYKTVEGTAEASFEIKRSKFFTHVEHVETEDRAREILDAVRKKYFDARHNCSAWILGEKSDRQKFNDDGEPSGTAGKPILESIKEKNLTNVIVIVTRYFGGIKLGANGLIRAYHHAAELGLDSAKILEVKSMLEVQLDFEYSFYNAIDRYIRQKNFPIESTSFENDISMKILIPPDMQKMLSDDLNEISSGNVLYEFRDEKYYFGK